jgi:hypothetical protein
MRRSRVGANAETRTGTVIRTETRTKTRVVAATMTMMMMKTTRTASIGSIITTTRIEIGETTMRTTIEETRIATEIASGKEIETETGIVIDIEDKPRRTTRQRRAGRRSIITPMGIIELVMAIWRLFFAFPDHG